MKTKVVIAIALLGAVLLGAMGVRRNLAGMTSQVLGVGISRALGVSDVHVGRVDARGVRSIALADVRIGEAFSIDWLTIDYDIMDILRNRVGLVESITGLHASGVDVNMEALETSLPAQRGPAPKKPGGTPGRRRASVPGGFNAPIEVRDISIIFPSESGLGKLDARKAEVEGSLLEGRQVWKVLLSDAVYSHGRSFDLKRVKVAFSLRQEAMEIHELEAELLDGSLRGELVLCRNGSDLIYLTGNIDISDVSYEGFEISACVKMDEDGAIRAQSDVKFPLAEGDGALEAEYEGSLRLPGVVIGVGNEAGGEARPPIQAGVSCEADGRLRLIDLRAGQSRLSNMELDVDASFSREQIKAVVCGEHASIDEIGRALGHAIPAEGWIDWRADLKLQDSTLAAAVTIIDGELRSELWPREFVDLRGSIELAQAMPGKDVGSQVEIYVPRIRAAMGVGEIELSGGGQRWNVRGSELEIEHPLMHGFADVEARIRTGDRIGIEGTLWVHHADIDVVTAGFSRATAIPDADLDLKVIVGDGVKVVREESWAAVIPSEVHIQGSVREPRASGYVEVGAGEVYLYDIPLEILSGRVDFSEDGDSPIEFSVVARDSSAEFPIMATIYGEPGDVHLFFEPESDVGASLAPGELLMKLLDARLRLYIMTRLGRIMNRLPGAITD